VLHAKANDSSVTVSTHCFITQATVSVVSVMVDTVEVVELHSRRLDHVVLL